MSETVVAVDMYNTCTVTHLVTKVATFSTRNSSSCLQMASTQLVARLFPLKDPLKLGVCMACGRVLNADMRPCKEH